MCVRVFFFLPRSRRLRSHSRSRLLSAGRFDWAALEWTRSNATRSSTTISGPLTTYERVSACMFMRPMSVYLEGGGGFCIAEHRCSQFASTFAHLELSYFACHSYSTFRSLSMLHIRWMLYKAALCKRRLTYKQQHMGATSREQAKLSRYKKAPALLQALF